MRLSRELRAVAGRRLRVCSQGGTRLPEGGALGAPPMAAKEGMPANALRVLEKALGMDLTAAGDTAEAVAAEGAYYLERILTCRRGFRRSLW